MSFLQLYPSNNHCNPNAQINLFFKQNKTQQKTPHLQPNIKHAASMRLRRICGRHTHTFNVNDLCLLFCLLTSLTNTSLFSYNDLPLLSTLSKANLLCVISSLKKIHTYKSPPHTHIMDVTALMALYCKRVNHNIMCFLTNRTIMSSFFLIVTYATQ